jgi:hypothetical protein
MFMLGAKAAKERSSGGQKNTVGYASTAMNLSELRERIACGDDLHTAFKA